MRLKDKVIIVTGSTSGIGQAIVERAVAEGARVLIHGIDQAAGEKLALALGSATKFHCADLLDPASPARIVAAAVQAFGRIDALVNNAAIVVRSTLATATLPAFERTIAINLRAPYFLIQAAFPYLKATEGCVLNIGSINAHSGESTLLDYSVSKGGLQTLSRNLANAHGVDRVRVNTVDRPGRGAPVSAATTSRSTPSSCEDISSVLTNRRLGSGSMARRSSLANESYLSSTASSSGRPST